MSTTAARAATAGATTTAEDMATAMVTAATSQY
jgi:hypothetical protein